jgi:hypothetical protein
MRHDAEMDPSTRWMPVGGRSPADLVDARLQLHWAAQLVSAVGTTLLPAAADDSHTNLEWLAGTAREPALASGLLAGQLTTDPPRCRAALHPDTLELYLLDEHGAGVAHHRLHGLTLSQGMVWLEHEISAWRRQPLPGPLRRRELDLPEHTVGRGAVFRSDDAAAFAELARWYANADTVLRDLADRTPNASSVRCWPHHFDIATLITVEPSPPGAGARTIGVGLSPGDASYAEPYWYVTPWPHPDEPRLATLAADGQWHRSGWLGAVLLGSRVVGEPSADMQARKVDAFLASAVQACRALL